MNLKVRALSLASALCLGACADVWGYADVTLGVEAGNTDATFGGGIGSPDGNAGRDASDTTGTIADGATADASTLEAATDSGAQGVQCGSATDCAPGYECVTLSDAGQCQQVCRVGPSFADCPALFWCRAFAPAVYDAGQEIGACTQQCNPTDPSASDAVHEACASGQRCDSTLDLQGHTACSPAGTGIQDASCQSLGDCAPGYGCDTATDRCEKYCLVDGGGCPVGVCAGFVPPSFDGTQPIGVCQ
jgi:hypothetical protein